MKDYYSVKEAAKLIGVSTNTLYSYLDSGKIKAQRIGKGRFRIPGSELAPFVKTVEEVDVVVTNRFVHAITKVATYVFVAVLASAITGLGFYYLFHKDSSVSNSVESESIEEAETPEEVKSAFDISMSTEPTSPLASPSATFRFALYNGTQTVGATASIEAALKKINSQTQITARAIALKTDYQETVLVDLVGNRIDDAQVLARVLGIPLSILPQNEKQPENADFLIIVGNDRIYYQVDH